jgi:hypothetical protein
MIPILEHVWSRPTNHQLCSVTSEKPSSDKTKRLSVAPLHDMGLKRLRIRLDATLNLPMKKNDSSPTETQQNPAQIPISNGVQRTDIIALYPSTESISMNPVIFVCAVFGPGVCLAIALYWVDRLRRREAHFNTEDRDA